MCVGVCVCERSGSLQVHEVGAGEHVAVDTSCGCTTRRHDGQCSVISVNRAGSSDWVCLLCSSVSMVTTSSSSSLSIMLKGAGLGVRGWGRKKNQNKNIKEIWGGKNRGNFQAWDDFPSRSRDREFLRGLELSLLPVVLRDEAGGLWLVAFQNDDLRRSRFPVVISRRAGRLRWPQTPPDSWGRRLSVCGPWWAACCWLSACWRRLQAAGRWRRLSVRRAESPPAQSTPPSQRREKDQIKRIYQSLQHKSVLTLLVQCNHPLLWLHQRQTGFHDCTLNLQCLQPFTCYALWYSGLSCVLWCRSATRGLQGSFRKSLSPAGVESRSKLTLEIQLFHTCRL